ncbi:TPA: helix-turn-helix domain-containing protein, partial [Shigella sonnei]
MDLVEQLKDVMERRGYSQTQVGRAIGRSGAVINQFLQGKYTGDNADLELRIEGFIARELEKQKAK